MAILWELAATYGLDFARLLALAGYGGPRTSPPPAPADDGRAARDERAVARRPGRGAALHGRAQGAARCLSRSPHGAAASAIAERALAQAGVARRAADAARGAAPRRGHPRARADARAARARPHARPPAARRAVVRGAGDLPRRVAVRAAPPLHRGARADARAVPVARGRAARGHERRAVPRDRRRRSRPRRTSARRCCCSRAATSPRRLAAERPSIGTPLALAQEYGASAHAALHHYVLTHAAALALLVVGRFPRRDGSLPVWRSVESRRYLRRFDRAAAATPRRPAARQPAARARRGRPPLERAARPRASRGPTRAAACAASSRTRTTTGTPSWCSSIRRASRSGTDASGHTASRALRLQGIGRAVRAGRAARAVDHGRAARARLDRDLRPLPAVAAPRRPRARRAALARRRRRPHPSARIGTSVLTPTLRYQPAIIAQAFATLGCLYPGRVWLGVGTGEAMNETPVTGDAWPLAGRQGAPPPALRGRRPDPPPCGPRSASRSRASTTAPTAPPSTTGRRSRSRSTSPPPARSPPSSRAARGDGFICTSGKPRELYDELLANVAEGARAAGRDPAALPRMIEIKVSYDHDREYAEECVRLVGGARALGRREVRRRRPDRDGAARRRQPRPRQLRRSIVSDDPDEVVERIRPYVELGFDELIFHAPGDDQARFLEQFARDVLPRLQAAYSREEPWPRRPRPPRSTPTTSCASTRC